jgi:hypothetical protein
MSTTRTYAVCKPRHLVRRTARIHAWFKNASCYGGRANVPLRNRRYEVKDSGRGPFRWEVIDWGRVA